MKNKRPLYWRLCYLGVVVLCVLTFTPLVIPSGRFMPLVAGMPRTLWAGILIYIGLVLLTFIGTRIYGESNMDRGEDK